tara:strand:- start:13 stop:195 length:183 start_codon:yes stop_codon:yes gene_type:complete
MSVRTKKPIEILISKLFLKYKKTLRVSVKTIDVSSAVMIAKAYDFFENELIDSETYNQRL